VLVCAVEEGGPRSVCAGPFGGEVGLALGVLLAGALQLEPWVAWHQPGLVAGHGSWSTPSIQLGWRPQRLQTALSANRGRQSGMTALAITATPPSTASFAALSAGWWSWCGRRARRSQQLGTCPNPSGVLD